MCFHGGDAFGDHAGDVVAASRRGSKGSRGARALLRFKIHSDRDAFDAGWWSPIVVFDFSRDFQFEVVGLTCLYGCNKQGVNDRKLNLVKGLYKL